MGNKEFYDKKFLNHKLVGRSDYRYKKTFNLLKRFVDVEPDWKVLDVGCSVGSFLKSIPLESKYGVDLSSVALEKAKSRGLNVSQCDVEIDKLPFEDNFFDIVFCTEVIEHLFSEKNAFKEFMRVLKPNRYLVITVPNDVLKYDIRLGIMFGKMFRKTEPYPFEDQHIRFFSSKRLKRVVELNGFSTVYNGALPVSFKGHSLRFIGRFISDNFPDLMSTTYGIICTKQ